MLTLSGVTKFFPGARVPALTEVNLEVGAGEVLGLIGLNGAGKTTAIRVAAGLTLPTRGLVRVDGLDIARQKPEASLLLGWVSESPQFEPSAKPLDLLAYFAAFHGLTGPEAMTKGLRLLREVDLDPRGLGRLRSFSQGMKKRFALAAAQIGNPRYLLLDEILNGLDPEGVHMVRRMVRDLRQRGIGVLLSSHILSEIERVADRMAVLHHGRVLTVLDAEGLSHRGAREIRLTIANVDDRVLRFLDTFGPTHIEDSGLIVVQTDADPGEVSQALAERDYRITSLGHGLPDLERFFLRLVSNPEGSNDLANSGDEHEPEKRGTGGQS